MKMIITEVMELLAHPNDESVVPPEISPVGTAYRDSRDEFEFEKGNGLSGTLTEWLHSKMCI